MVNLDTILDLVGTLDDSIGEQTARERFREYLAASVDSVGIVRDYIETCLRNKGPQYDRALQDLVNHVGTFLGFEVKFGRYRGVSNDIGFDGLWKRGDFYIVAEVKTTDAYAIQTRPVIGYVDELISAGTISDWDHALGLYIFGRTDSDLMQLANTISAERRSNQLRISTVDSLLSLAELVQRGQITSDESVSLLRPGGVFVEETVQLLSRLAAQIEAESAERPTNELAKDQSAATEPNQEHAASDSDRISLLTPVSNLGDESGEAIIRGLLERGWYVMKDGTPGLNKLKPGDKVCFYLTSTGVVADAEVSSRPEQKSLPDGIPVREPSKYRWRFRISKPRFYFDNPIVIDENLRSTLDAFIGKDPTNPWSWFVQGTHYVSIHDFNLLTSSTKSDSNL